MSMRTLCSPVVVDPDLFGHAQGDEVGEANHAEDGTEKGEGGRFIFEASRMGLEAESVSTERQRIDATKRERGGFGNSPCPWTPPACTPRPGRQSSLGL